jgi:shikimate kinase
MHVVLIGLRCSGKTTVGRLLAERLRRPFIDLDDRTAAILACASPGDALRTHKEPAFREAEAKALREVLAEPSPSIIALGGGTPTAPGAAAMLLEAQGAGRAKIVYLRTTPDVLTARVSDQDPAKRPSLTGAPQADEVAVLFQRRDALYTRLSDRIIDASARAEDTITQLTNGFA